MTHQPSALRNLEKRQPAGDRQGLGRPAPGRAEGSPRSIFETSLYREIYGCTDVLSVDAVDRAGARPLLFHDRGDHAVCLARTAPLDAAAIAQASDALFQLDRLRFLVFEDLHLACGNEARAPLRFHYQNDWILPLGGDAGAMPASLRRKLDQNLRRLEREHANVTLEIKPRPDRELVAQAMEFSRAKIEASGQAYLIDDEEAGRLARLFGAAGTAAVLRHGDRPASVDLFIEHDDKAYAFLGGYDTAYSRASPGLLTIRHAIDHFERRGFRSVHLLWGDGAYKAKLGARKAPLSTLIVPRNGAAWLHKRLLANAARFSALDLKRRIKERSRLAEPLNRVMQWPRRLGATFQGS